MNNADAPECSVFDGGAGMQHDRTRALSAAQARPRERIFSSSLLCSARAGSMRPSKGKSRREQEITEDTYIHAIRPVSPLGTHHTLMTIGEETDDCTSSVATGFVYAAGVGAQGLTPPDGVA
jgi:hypothetical protein